jgi:hypothetical protein
VQTFYVPPIFLTTMQKSVNFYVHICKANLLFLSKYIVVVGTQSCLAKCKVHSIKLQSRWWNRAQLYCNRPVHFIKNENVSEKEPISADKGATKRGPRDQYAIATYNITKYNNTKTTNNKGKIHGVF